MTKEAIKLKAQSRDEKNGKAKKIRKAGFIPAVVYGAGAKNQAIKIKETDFKRVFGLAGESHLIDLIIDNGAARKVIVKDSQADNVKGGIIHVDFYQVSMNKKITTEIPLNFIGESKAVKELGGTLIKNMDAVLVECLPGDLVDNISVDLSALNNFHDAIKLSGLKLPKGVELKAGHDEIVISVIEPVKEEVVAPAAEAEAAAAAEKTEEAKEEKESEKKEGGK